MIKLLVELIFCGVMGFLLAVIIYKNAKKWISQITIEGKTKYLGLFDNEEEANKKYLETLKDL